MDLEHYCSSCGEYRRFWRVAGTSLHLGEKVKFRCEECDSGFVRVDGVVDTGAEA
jgi:transposase-like protein